MFVNFRLLGPHPNCYTYSKRLAEALVSQYADRIPISIARPSIGKSIAPSNFLFFYFLFFSYRSPPDSRRRIRWFFSGLIVFPLPTVTPSYLEPVPGWVDSLNGPVGVIVAAGKGVIRSMLCAADYEAEVVPVDIAINALILIAWKRSATAVG